MRRVIGLALAAAMIAAPAAAQNTAPAVVTFERTSDALTPAARAGLDAFARRYAEGQQVIISGHATEGEAIAAIKADGGTAEEAAQSALSFAVGLSQRRSANVRSYLATRGIPDGVMTTQAFGASRPVDPSGKPSAADRRVEVTEGPGSGW